MKKTALLSFSLIGCGAAAAASASARVKHSGFYPLLTPTPLLQIRSDGQQLCGVTTEHRAMCASFAASSSKLSWQTLDKDGVIAVAVANSTVWVINDMDQLGSSALAATGGNGPWKTVNTRAVDIATDGIMLGVIGTNGYQFYQPVESATTDHSNWNGVWMKSRSIDVLNDKKIVSVLADGSTLFAPQDLFPASDGPFRSISSDGTFACATRDTTNTVYCVTKNMTSWKPVGGRMSQISVRGGRLFGVGSMGTLWTTELKLSTNADDSLKELDEQEKAADDARASEPARFVTVASKGPIVTSALFTTISYDGGQLCGVALNSGASCLVERTGTWQSKGTQVRSISVDGSLLYAIDTSGQLVWRDMYQKDAAYTPIKLPDDITGRAARVQADGRLLCVQDENQFLFCAKLDNATHQASWFQVGNSTKTMVNDFSVANGSIVWVLRDQPGVTSFGLPLAPATNNTYGAVATDGNIVCASQAKSFEVLCASRETKSWRSIGEFLTQMSIRNGTMYSVAKEGGLKSIKLAIKTDPDATRRPTYQTSNNMRSNALGAGSIVGIVVAVIAVIGVFTVVWRRRRSIQARRKANDETETDPFPRLHTPTTGSQAPTVASGVSDDSTLTMWAKDEVLLAKRLPINDLEFGPKVSRGAFGDVYKGRFNGQIVAIKVLAETKRCNLTEVSKFAQEARFMAMLQHDYIACLVGVAWSTPSNLCIVSEFLAGGDVRGLLQRYLDEGRPEGFSPEKIKIALHVAQALTYLHSLQPIVVHRDLKSKNILLTENGDAKLTDFGVSREMEDATMTAGVGSILWMAPEVIQGKRYDEKADVYSFGVVLSELDTNELPFAAAQREGVVLPAEIGNEHKRLPEVAILQLVVQGRLSVQFSESADPTLKEIGQACVSVDPSARPTAATLSYRIHQLWRGMTEHST